jgi:hypothetical protein
VVSRVELAAQDLDIERNRWHARHVYVEIVAHCGRQYTQEDQTDASHSREVKHGKRQDSEVVVGLEDIVIFSCFYYVDTWWPASW